MNNQMVYTATCSLSTEAMKQIKSGETIPEFFERFSQENPGYSKDQIAIILCVPHEARGAYVSQESYLSAPTMEQWITVLTDLRAIGGAISRISRYKEMGGPSFTPSDENKLFLLFPAPAFWGEELPDVELTLVDDKGDSIAVVEAHTDVSGSTEVTVTQADAAVTVQETDEGKIQVTVQEEKPKKNFLGF